MYATHFFENQILNVLRNVTLTGYSNLHIGLFMNNPTNTGTAGLEVNYTGYERLPITFTPPFEESGGMAIRNTTDILWETAPQDVGNVHHIGIFDSPVIGAGNMLLYGELTIPLNIRSGQQPAIYTGDILYILQGDTTRYFKTAVLNVLRNQTLAGFQPHLALFDGDPELSGLELSGPSYARPQISFGDRTIEVGGQSRIANNALVRFNSPTDTWGDWNWDGLLDAATGGNLIFKFQNPIPETIHRNYVAQVFIGEYMLEVN